jgi:hypothetical protein
MALLWKLWRLAKRVGWTLPKGAVEVEPGVYVMREVRSAFAVLSAIAKDKSESK